MEDKLIEVLRNRGPLTIPEIGDAISQEGKEVRTLLSSLLSTKTIKVIVEGCTGCACGSCDPVVPKYDLV